jgi:hypothetical protein
MRTGGARIDVVAVAVAGAVAVFAGAGCRRSLESGADASGTVMPADAGVTDRSFVSDVPLMVLDGALLEVAFDRFLPDGVPQADPDAGACTQPPGEFPTIVCFGSDPAPYQQYLEPGDGGPAPGQCPTRRDFMRVGGEICGYTSCGPLLGSAVPADAGATAGDAGTDCCFWVARLCGV